MPLSVKCQTLWDTTRHWRQSELKSGLSSDAMFTNNTWLGFEFWVSVLSSLKSRMSKVLNINIGLLGHIDSGKTSLAKALSTTQSTAAYDKNPQSQERGITIDLGFSSLTVELPEQLYHEMKERVGSDQDLGPRHDWSLQMTMVDCPGHAQLIRTIIGGAQIIDLMILVVDIVKGIQTQTAECLVIGEITCDKMIVALNKVDLVPEDKRQISIEKMSKRIGKTLEKTRFSSAPIVPVTAHPNPPDGQPMDTIGIQELLKTICRIISYPKRNPNSELILSVDHCFAIRGSGTVMTGTIIQGSVAVNDVSLVLRVISFNNWLNVCLFRDRTSKFLPSKPSEKSNHCRCSAGK